MLAELQNKKIGVLLGGESHEREISILSGNAVYEALSAAGLSVNRIDLQGDPKTCLSDHDIDVAFLALHGKGGEDGSIQEVLDTLGIPYTGSDAIGSRNAFDKRRTKELLSQAGLPVPYSAVVTASTWQSVIHEFSFPLFIKPVDDGSSIGVHMVHTLDELTQLFERIFDTYADYVIEERIVGREITVGIVGNTALPIIELKTKHSFYDYEAKYTAGHTEYCIPAAVSENDRIRYQTIALAVHCVLGARDMSRVDMMLDMNGAPSILELNSLPGFTSTSLLPKAAREEGISFDALCMQLLGMALERADSKAKSI